MIKDSGERIKSGKLNKRGDTRGCFITHGHSNDRIYHIWCDMKRRCKNPKNKRYNRYGGRGICVCEEWENFENFYDWAIQNGFEKNLTLDRIDVNGNYEPENCRWISRKEQMRNTRSNHLLTYNGDTKTMAEWAEIAGIPYSTLKQRINKYNYSVEKALTKPAKKS